jgi:hypothetical protein
VWPPYSKSTNLAVVFGVQNQTAAVVQERGQRDVQCRVFAETYCTWLCTC